MGILQLCILFLDKLLRVSTEGDKLKLMAKGTSTAIKKKQIVIPTYITMGEQILHKGMSCLLMHRRVVAGTLRYAALISPPSSYSLRCSLPSDSR